MQRKGFGGLMVAAAILAVSLGGLGQAGDDGAASVASAVPFAAAPRDAPAADATAAAPAETSRDRPAPAVEVAPKAAEPAKPAPRAGDHPANLLQLPASAESAVVFDLEANLMHVFEHTPEGASEVGSFFVAVGKNGIEKSREGDEKTPVGIYFVTSYIPGDQLPPIYGDGAYPINYPNSWDRLLGRTGSGIWIHGTDKDEESLLAQSSRGCLTLYNSDFRTMSRFVGIRRTPVIVTDAVGWTTAERLEAERSGLAEAVETWRRDWESLDTEAYLGHYSRTFRTDSMDFTAWSAHKRRVNASKSYISVAVDDVGIYAYPGEDGLFLVTFEQRYGSSNFQAQRFKHQYWRREGGAWRIVHEGGA